MEKYDVRFCSCGRIHFVENAAISNAIENDKQVVVVCNNCGKAFAIGAEKTYDDYYAQGEDFAYMMYTKTLVDTVIEDMVKVHSMVFSRGEKVWMETGGYATYHGDTFIDWDSKHNDRMYLKMSREEFENARQKVNKKSTFRTMSKEQIDSLEGYMYLFDKSK